MLKVVILMQENKTPDFYFPTLALWGANVRNAGNLLAAPPTPDPTHDRNAWVHYQMGDYQPPLAQVDNDAVLPFYSWLAKQFTYCDYHFGLGTNSTPGHMLAVGGQTPTLRNPPRGTAPVWNLPTIFKHVEAAGKTWGAFTGIDRYPLSFYQELLDPPSQSHIYTSSLPNDDQFTRMAWQRALPDFCFVWSPSGYDEHPPDQSKDPGYVSKGENLTWQRVDALVQAGDWADTVFILTWDDWGGYADHVQTPNIETVIDALHPNGFQVIGGSRIPMLMFGGKVAQGIERSWHSHACIAKTVVDLFGLPPFGVARVDDSASLAARVVVSLVRPAPPQFGAAIVQPVPPQPTPSIPAPPVWTGGSRQPLAEVIANGGVRLPAPSDATVSATPPHRPTGL